MRVCLFVCVWDMSGCFVCDFLWGERSSHTFSGLLISLQRVKLLLRSHSVITLQSRKCLRLHPCYPSSPWDGPENCSQCYFLQTHYSGSLFIYTVLIESIYECEIESKLCCGSRDRQQRKPTAVYLNPDFSWATWGYVWFLPYSLCLDTFCQ